jgi:hypothetical protein
LTMLRTYHKGTALSGLDKLIPHSIDGVTADIMIQDLALTRPFAEVAAHICYPDQPMIKQLYQTQIFMNNQKLFTTDQLSAGMARESIESVGLELGVNSWRHISTAFKRKLGRFAEELLEEDDQDTIEALQAGHSRSTENRVYGLSPDALVGGPEDLLPQFLKASTNWQLLMHTVPGGLELAYMNARTNDFKQLAESGRFGPDIEDTASPNQTVPPTVEPTGFKTDVHASTNVMANRIAEKLEERLTVAIEQRLMTRVVDALAPALEGIIKEAVKAAIPQKPAMVPTNDIDFDDIYAPDHSLEDFNKTPKAPGMPDPENQHTRMLTRPPQQQDQRKTRTRLPKIQVRASARISIHAR